MDDLHGRHRAKRSGVSNPEISDLTHKQPQPYRRDREDSVPGGEFLSLLNAILS
jgi:hypothetical protein